MFLRKFLTLLNLVLLFTLVTLTLYIFDLIDIPFLHPTEEIVEEPEVKEPEKVPEDKVIRKKSYDELMQKGDLYLEKEFYNLAIDSYTQANKENPTKIDPLIKIGDIHTLLNEYNKAKLISLEILKMDPHSVSGKLILGKAHIGLEDFATAKNVFDSITTDDQAVQYHQAIMALYFGEYERGRSLLFSVIEKVTDPNITEKAKNFIGALNEFDSYQAGQHNHLKVLLARSYAQAYEPQIAKELIWNVLREQRDYRDAWIILGFSYLKLNKFKDAVDALEEAKRQDSEKPVTLFYLGLAYAGNNQINEAIQELELALSNGYEPRVHIEQKLAELYFQIEDYEQASKKYEEVISLNSSDIDYFVRPIWIYIDMLGNPVKAQRLAEKAHLHHPDNPMSYNLLGWTLIANNDYINAKKNLEKALELNETFDAPYLNLGWLYEKQENYDKAKLYYKKAYEFGRGKAVGDLAAERYNSLIEIEKNNIFMVNILN